MTATARLTRPSSATANGSPSNRPPAPSSPTGAPPAIPLFPPNIFRKRFTINDLCPVPVTRAPAFFRNRVALSRRTLETSLQGKINLTITHSIIILSQGSSRLSLFILTGAILTTGDTRNEQNYRYRFGNDELGGRRYGRWRTSCHHKLGRRKDDAVGGCIHQGRQPP